MERHRFDEKSLKGLAAKIGDVSIDFQHPGYRLEINPDAVAGETGLLWLVRVVPSSRDRRLPSFVVRIGHDHPDALDVDLRGGKAERRAFKRDEDGCWGHRAARINPDVRCYRLDFGAKGVRYLSGALTLSEIRVGIQGRAGGHASAEGGLSGTT